MPRIHAVTTDQFDALPRGDAFAPAFYDVEGDGLYYFDGRIMSSVAMEDEDAGPSLRIATWDSELPGTGNSRRALEWLRQRFSSIVVLGAGELDADDVSDISTRFWTQMRESRLVDAIFLDDGTRLGDGPDRDAGGADPPACFRQ